MKLVLKNINKIPNFIRVTDTNLFGEVIKLKRLNQHSYFVETTKVGIYRMFYYSKVLQRTISNCYLIYQSQRNQSLQSQRISENAVKHLSSNAITDANVINQLGTQLEDSYLSRNWLQTVH